MAGKRKQQAAQQRFWKWVGIGLAALFVGSILWSMWVDTVRPLLVEGDTVGVMLHLVGLPLILAGTAVIVYGGALVVRATFQAMGSDEISDNLAQMRASGGAGARWANARILFRAWLPGLGWMGLGFLLIAIGGFLINL